MKTPAYKVGDVVTNLTILKILEESTSSRRMKYLVRYECCGATNIMAHNRIRQRIGDESVTCTRCTNRTGVKPESERPVVHTDGWVSPSSMLPKR